MKSYKILAALFLFAALAMTVVNFISHFVGGSNDLSGQVAYILFITGFLVFRSLDIEEKIRELDLALELENSIQAEKDQI